jgi:hypothetical protein
MHAGDACASGCAMACVWLYLSRTVAPLKLHHQAAGVAVDLGSVVVSVGCHAQANE